MNWWLPHNFNNKKPILEKRALIMRSIRQFFDNKGFVEVNTPALQICPVMDAHIHAFSTRLFSVGRIDSKIMYLHTSPEFDMKKLLAAGMESIYQICPVYRNAEGSKRHSPEFMILEWYRAHTNYNYIMDDCIDILRYVAEKLGIDSYTHKGMICDPFINAYKISVCEVFSKYADINLQEYVGDRDSFAEIAQQRGIRIIESDLWDDIFHAVMAEKIEPMLGVGAPTILYDYPVSMAALSRKKPDLPDFAERFELYVCGIELGNAFSELTDAKEQRARYETEMEIKEKLYGEIYPPDESFFSALEYMPESAGIALGIDRLVMLATGADNINDVLWAPVSGFKH